MRVMTAAARVREFEPIRGSSERRQNSLPAIRARFWTRGTFLVRNRQGCGRLKPPAPDAVQRECLSYPIARFAWSLGKRIALLV